MTPKKSRQVPANDVRILFASHSKECIKMKWCIISRQAGWTCPAQCLVFTNVIKTDDVCKAKAGRNVASAAPAAAAAYLEWAGSPADPAARLCAQFSPVE